MSLLEIEHLVVRAGDVDLVEVAGLELEAGRWLSVVGPNGAGKTSLVEAVAGLRRFEGVVRVAGRDIGRLSERERARRLAFVPQHPAVPSGMSLTDYVGLGRTAHQGVLVAVSPAGRARVAEAIGRLGLEDLARRDMATLSGGERQRAVLARTLAQEAPLAVLDEPTTGLDLAHQLETLDALRREVDEGRLAVLSTLHDLTLAGQYADELALLDRGRLVLRGPSRDVVRSSELGAAYGLTLRVIDVDGRDVVVPEHVGRHGAVRPIP